MKITVIGGGGIRAPQLVQALCANAEATGLNQLALYDIDRRKAAVTFRLSQSVAQKENPAVALQPTFDLDDALDGADAIITTIRPGFEAGRAKDERIALNRGVLGQETTGPAGFAFACRSAPEVVRYAQQTLDKNPDAWIVNFTNPASLVTEALQRSGFERSAGICDSSDSGLKKVANHAGVNWRELESWTFGLNHLSWVGPALHNGKNILEDVLFDKDYQAAHIPWMPLDLLETLRLLPNEYLYYFYRAKSSLQALLDADECRGEEILRINGAILDTLEKNAAAGSSDEELHATYKNYLQRREATYMISSRKGKERKSKAEPEGYAGVALDLLQNLRKDDPVRMVLNVPNQGALDFLEPNDIVEITCEVGRGAWKPVAPPQVPEKCKELSLAVKKYERLAVEAILEKRVEAAVEGLRLHPLVQDEECAYGLFKDYRDAWPEVFQGWK